MRAWLKARAIWIGCALAAGIAGFVAMVIAFGLLAQVGGIEIGLALLIGAWVGGMAYEDFLQRFKRRWMPAAEAIG